MTTVAIKQSNTINKSPKEKSKNTYASYAPISFHRQLHPSDQFSNSFTRNNIDEKMKANVDDAAHSKSPN